MAEVISFAAAAQIRKKIPWSPSQAPRKAPLEVGGVWVFEKDRDTCVIQAFKHNKKTGRLRVLYTISSSGETVECAETFFRANWCEKEQFLNKVNKILSRVVSLRAVPPLLKKGWQVWRDNETGEFYIITGERQTKSQTVHTFLKGMTEGEISSTALEEGFTFNHTV